MALLSTLHGPILVTGASGFIGSHLVRRLLSGGAQVHALVRKTSDLSRLVDVTSDLTLVYGDLGDSESIEKVVAKVKPRGVFHLGVSNVIGGLGADSETIVNTNMGGTLHLMDAVAKGDFDFFVQMGSFLEYGAKDHAIREDERCEPGELYGITKLAGTLYGNAIARASQKPIVMLRLFTPYGPRNDGKRLTHHVISSALKGEAISLTAPSTSRDFIFVDDVVDLLVEAALKAGGYHGEIFNVGSGIRTSIGEVVSFILKQTGSKSEVRWGSFRDVSYDSDLWQADMTKTFSNFEWRPTHSVFEGLDKTIEHFKQFGY